jgi:8-oxo-dGTP diphosphatase
MTSTNAVHVAVAVVKNDRDEVLIARRPDHVHQGGLWEFPGGKLEPGEDIAAALARELHEELGITPQSHTPLIRLPHDYGDKSVLLDVHVIERFDNQPHGKEGQPVRWVPKARLSDYAFPAANRAIVQAVQLPAVYLITPEPEDKRGFLGRLEIRLQSGSRLIQLRAKQIAHRDLVQLSGEVLSLCRKHDARLLINTTPELVREIGADGVHLTSARLMALRERPLNRDFLVATSCHTPEELRHAAQIDVDFAVAAPVMPTKSHPTAKPLGWQGFYELTETAVFPVYALGGMSSDDVGRARKYGGQGIAAIGSLW